VIPVDTLIELFLGQTKKIVKKSIYSNLITFRYCKFSLPDLAGIDGRVIEEMKTDLVYGESLFLLFDVIFHG